MPYFVYLMANGYRGTVYAGVTNDLLRRVHEHKAGVVAGFTSCYEVNRLVWFASGDCIEAAIRREKQIKKWRRDWKIALVEKENPRWMDLYPRVLGVG